MTKFLFDALHFGLVPFHSVTVCSALSCVATFLFFQTHGWVLGTVHSSLCYGMVLRHGLQTAIMEHAWRAGFGASWGAMVCGLLSFRWHVAPAVHSPFWKGLQVLLALLCLCVFVKLHLRRPQVVQALDGQDLVQRIVASVSAEGPHEADDATDDAAAACNDKGWDRDSLRDSKKDSKKVDSDVSVAVAVERSKSKDMPSSPLGQEREVGVVAAKGTKVKFSLQDGTVRVGRGGRGPPVRLCTACLTDLNQQRARGTCVVQGPK